MKKLLIIACMLLPCAGLSALFVAAQTPVDDATARQMMDKVNDTARKMKTMQCTFTQIKAIKVMRNKMVSNGKMCYSQPSMLRWEYTSPYAYTFIINGTKVLMKSKKKKDVVDTNGNKLFREITNIMLSSVTGRCLTDKQNFKTRMFVNGDKWIAKLTPVKKELKQLFSTLIVTFDERQMAAIAVEMIEKSGDSTVIELHNIKKNVSINSNEFDL